MARLDGVAGGRGGFWDDVAGCEWYAGIQVAIREGAAAMSLGLFVMLLAAVYDGAPIKRPTIEEIHARPSDFARSRLRICGEVSEDGRRLYSDTVYPLHGRVGIRLRSNLRSGRGRCITGRLIEEKSDRSEIAIDAPVHEQYVFVPEK